MNRKRLCWMGWLALLLCCAGSVSAAFTMYMTITPPAIQAGENSTMGIQLVNRGDEVAYRGTATLIYPDGLKADPVGFDRLDPNVTQTKTMDFSADPRMLSGTYPVVVALQFHDSNDYPIYMIFESMVNIGKPSSSAIFATLSTAQFPLEGSGTLTLKLKNADDVAHTVRTRLIMPMSISSNDTNQTIVVQPRSETALDYRVTNFMALQDSDFTVLTAVEYDDDTHHSTLGRGRVQLKEAVADSTKPTYFFVGGVAAVIVAVLAYIAYSQRKDDKEDNQEGPYGKEPA